MWNELSVVVIFVQVVVVAQIVFKVINLYKW